MPPSPRRSLRPAPMPPEARRSAPTGWRPTGTATGVGALMTTRPRRLQPPALRQPEPRRSRRRRTPRPSLRNRAALRRGDRRDAGVPAPGARHARGAPQRRRCLAGAAPHEADASLTSAAGIACASWSPIACRCCWPRRPVPPSRPCTPAGAAWPRASSRRRWRRSARRPAARRPMSSAWLGAVHRPRRLRGRRRRARCASAPSGCGAASLPRRQRPAAKWHADLAGLARDRLAALRRARCERRRRGAPSPTPHASSRFGATASPAAWPPPSGSTAADASARRRAARRGRRSEQVQHDRQRQRAVEHEGEERAEQRCRPGSSPRPPPS